MAISDRKKALLVSLVTLGVLLSALFIPAQYARLAAGGLFAAAAAAAAVLLKKRGMYSVNRRQVLLLLTASAALFTMLRLLLGLHFGFYASYPALSVKTLLFYILPSAAIVVGSEILRRVLLGQVHVGYTVLSYVICLVGEVLLAGGVTRMGDRYQFMDIVAQALLPAILSNLVYHYLSKRYGMYPNVVFRLILSVLPYFIPVTPAIPEALNALLSLVLPWAVWFFIDILYEKKFKNATRRTSVWSYAAIGAAVLGAVLFVLLTTGQFRYGSLVIATPSMQGTLEVGDAILYEEYDGVTPIEEEDIIIFTKNNATLVVHRVVEVENINGQVRYYTKGDANPDVDFGYITAENVTGIVRMRIPYFGSAALWFRNLFE